MNLPEGQGDKGVRSEENVAHRVQARIEEFTQSLQKIRQLLPRIYEEILNFRFKVRIEFSLNFQRIMTRQNVSLRYVV